MFKIYSNSRSFSEGLTTLLKDKYQLVSEWKGHLVQRWNSFLKNMQNRPNVAITVFTVANLIFFTLINNLAWSLEKRVHDIPQKLSEGDRRFNYFLIDGIVVGGSVLTFNIALSKLSQYPLNKSTIAAVTVGSIALRYFLHIPFGENEDDDLSILNEDDISDLDNEVKKAKIPSKDQDIIEDQNDHITQIPVKSPINKAKSLLSLKKEEQKEFLNEFCKDIQNVLKDSFQYVDFENEQRLAQDIFLENMNKGIATIEDHPDLCRAVNVPIQAGFEKLLCTMLIKGDVKKANVLFLTGLPCTPLRTPLQNIDTEKTAEWKKWTVDIRTQTVRALEEEGATIFVCYSHDDYQALPNQSTKGKSECDTYEIAKSTENIVDCPLNAPIPKELIGAVYFFSDADDNRYILATQGIQIQNHGTTPKECWKIWFGAEDDPKIQARFAEILQFVSEHTTQPILDEMKLDN